MSSASVAWPSAPAAPFVADLTTRPGDGSLSIAVRVASLRRAPLRLGAHGSVEPRRG